MKTNSQRTRRININIVGSLVIKGVSVLTGFILVPVTLDYIGTYHYGIWLTISSFLLWFSFFEIGLGNGLRNNLAKAIAENNYSLGKEYVSTTYALLVLIFGMTLLVFYGVNPFVNWMFVLNTDVDPKLLEKVASIVFTFCFIRFVVKLIGVVLVADQRPALANMLDPIGNVLSLCLILILKDISVHYEPLLCLSFIMSSMPVVVMLIFSIFFFGKKYRKIAPSIKSIRLEHSGKLLSLGAKFFLLEMFFLILFQSSNILIAHFFGQEEVASYNIAFKYFNILSMLFAIIVAPYWSAYTEAWVRQDIEWIKKSVNFQLKIWCCLVGFCVIMLSCSDAFFSIWLGSETVRSLNISFDLKLLLVIYVIVASFGRVFTVFVNGIGLLRVQIISRFLGVTLFFILIYFFIKKMNMGVEGIIFAIICADFYSIFVAPIQYRILINNMDGHSIWYK